jgi:hypothetical protein
MQALDSTHPAPGVRTDRRLLVLIDGPFPDHQEHRAGWIAARARGADVLVVAPTLPLPGERWIIDLDARRARARASLRSWIDALADQAVSIRGEIADENPRLAVADALAGFDADEFLTTLVPRDASAAQRAPLERLGGPLERLRAPLERLRVGHA